MEIKTQWRLRRSTATGDDLFGSIRIELACRLYSESVPSDYHQAPTSSK